MVKRIVPSARIALPLLLALTVVLRLGAMVAIPDSFRDDPDSYLRFASNLAQHGIYGPNPAQPSAYRPPGYPLLLSVAIRMTGSVGLAAAILHLTAAAATTWIAYRLTESLLYPINPVSDEPTHVVTATRSHAVLAPGLAALLVAVDPLLLRQSTLLMTETVFTLFFAGLLLAWLRLASPACSSFPGYWLLTPACLALCALTRPAIWAFWFGLPLVAPTQGRKWLAATGAALLLCSPWVARNWIALGTPILTTTHGGYTLWLAHNPVFYHEVIVAGAPAWTGPTFDAWTAENDRQTTGMNEAQRDAHFRRQAFRWMSDHPAHAARSMIHHFLAFWSVLPHGQSESVRVGSAVYYAVLYVLALAGLVLHRKPRPDDSWRMLLWAIGAFSCVHLFYWSNIRMRAPLIPVLAVFASLGICLMVASSRRYFDRKPRDEAPKKSC